MCCRLRRPLAHEVIISSADLNDKHNLGKRGTMDEPMIMVVSDRKQKIVRAQCNAFGTVLACMVPSASAVLYVPAICSLCA